MMNTLATQPKTQAVLNRLGEERLLGIVRTDSAELSLWAASVLLDAGFQAIEVPYTVPDAGSVIEALCTRYPHAVIGAGTVLEARQALDALGAGARFLVAPVLVEPLIQFGLEQDVAVVPGCMTPTEIYRAWTLGAPAVKFFPAESAGGAEFIRSLRGPLPQIPLIATGGIELSHVAAYLKAGTLAVGVGAPLIPREILTHRDESRLKALATEFLHQRNEA